MNYASCFVQTCIFIVAMVTGQLLGLKGDGGCVLIENERLKYLEKSLTHGIFVIPSESWQLIWFIGPQLNRDFWWIMISIDSDARCISWQIVHVSRGILKRGSRFFGSRKISIMDWLRFRMYA